MHKNSLRVEDWSYFPPYENTMHLSLCYNASNKGGSMANREKDLAKYELLDSYEVMVKPFLEDIIMWREKGLTLTAICKRLSITTAQFSRYMRNYQELYDTWYTGTISLILDLENTMFREAKGYYYKEIDVQTLEDASGKIYGTKTITKRRYHFPQMPALIKSLEVLHNNKWGENMAEDHDIEIKIDKELEEYSE